MQDGREKAEIKKFRDIPSDKEERDRCPVKASLLEESCISRFQVESQYEVKFCSINCAVGVIGDK